MRTTTLRIGLVVSLMVASTAIVAAIVLPGGSAAGASAALVQHPTRATTADLAPNTDFVVPWSIPPTAGDTFLVAATNYCSVHPSTTQVVTSNPGGWTEVNHAAGTPDGGFMFGKLILWRWTGPGVPGNVVLQMQGATSSCDLDVALFEYRGLSADPIDANVQASFDGTPAPWTLPAVTTTQANEILLVVLGARADGPWVSAVTPGFTNEVDNATSGGTSNMGIAADDRALTAAGSYTTVASFCAGCGWHPGAIILGLRVGSSTATTTTRPGPTTTVPRTTTVPPTTTTTMPPPVKGCPCSIWPNNGVPTAAIATDGRPVNLGVKFRTDITGAIKGIRFYKTAANTGVHIGDLWSSTGTLLAAGTFTGESASGWQTMTFAKPVRVNAGATYIASYHTTVGHYAYTYDSFGTQVDNAPLHALASVAAGGNGVFAYNVGAQFPVGMNRSTNYWVDVILV